MTSLSLARLSNRRLAAALTLAGLALAVVLALLSDGVYHDDDICHYIFARDALSGPGRGVNWISLLHEWARPGYNVPAALAAKTMGLLGCRLLSVLETAAVAWLAWLIGRRIAQRAGVDERWAAAAPALVWLQPLTMTLGITTLTETAAALYMAMGVWLYLRGNRVWAMAAFSAMFVTRYETMALGPILGAAVVYDVLRENDWKAGGAVRRLWPWGALLAALWGPVLYCMVAWMVELSPAFSPLYMLSKPRTTEYGSGPIYHFLSIWPEAAGMGGLVLAAGGAIALGRRAWLPAALIVGLVTVHSVLFWRGMFATGGYSRFLVPLAAPLAAMGALGLAEIRRARNRSAAAATMALAGGWIALVAFRWGPLRPDLWRLPAQLSVVGLTALLVGAAVAALAARAEWAGKLCRG